MQHAGADVIADGEDGPDAAESTRRRQRVRGERIANKDQIILNSNRKSESSASIHLIFQETVVGKPFMSVGQICDRGFNVAFKSKHELVVEETNGKMVCTFGCFEAAFATKKTNLARPG